MEDLKMLGNQTSFLNLTTDHVTCISLPIGLVWTLELCEVSILKMAAPTNWHKSTVMTFLWIFWIALLIYLPIEYIGHVLHLQHWIWNLLMKYSIWIPLAYIESGGELTQMNPPLHVLVWSWINSRLYHRKMRVQSIKLKKKMEKAIIETDFENF